MRVRGNAAAAMALALAGSLAAGKSDSTITVLDFDHGE